MGKRGPAPLIEQEDMEQLISWGYSTKQMAERFGCSTRTISKWRAKYGLTELAPEKGHRPSPERLQRYEDLLDEGWPYSEIAKTEGTTVTLLRRYFPGRGLNPTEIGELGMNAQRHKRKVYERK